MKLAEFDLQDALLCAGVICLCAGVGFIYWPAALIVFGLMCLACVRLMDRSVRAPKP